MFCFVLLLSRDRQSCCLCAGRIQIKLRLILLINAFIEDFPTDEFRMRTTEYFITMAFDCMQWAPSAKGLSDAATHTQIRARARIQRCGQRDGHAHRTEIVFELNGNNKKKRNMFMWAIGASDEMKNCNCNGNVTTICTNAEQQHINIC